MIGLERMRVELVRPAGARHHLVARKSGLDFLKRV